jgi:hypothetical protein
VKFDGKRAVDKGNFLWYNELSTIIFVEAFN